MAKKTNFLIGNAENLAYKVPPPLINPDSKAIYTFSEVWERLQPQFSKVIEEQKSLTAGVCPEDFSVSKLTMHPSFIAKGFYPKKLLREIGANSIGSQGVKVLPDKWKRVGEPELTPSTSIFIAAKRSNLEYFYNSVINSEIDDNIKEQLMTVWSLHMPVASEKIKNYQGSYKNNYEVGLHLLEGSNAQLIKTSFIEYASNLGFKINVNYSVDVSNLWFVPVEGEEKLLADLAKFSFVRLIRPVPALRSFQPMMKSLSISSSVTLPDSQPVSSDINVAILDGGLPKENTAARYIKRYVKSDENAEDYENGPEHGLGVTSAFLFGPLEVGEVANRPYSYVDVIRVLDKESNGEDPLELYRTLKHIEDVLISRHYDFINLSLGPNLPIEDDDIHSWTSVIDSHLSDGETLLTVAAGNNGESDRETQLNRIQVPADCVNALAVGAATSTSCFWRRATYSAMGPGRSPGRVKPDLLAFGGNANEYFHVLNEGDLPEVSPQLGTSFASPYLMRNAVGIRAILGPDISLLAIKALLIHSAHKNGDNGDNDDCHEVGWGKVPDLINEIVESPPSIAKILYQGELHPGKYLRVPLPLPEAGLLGKVNIKATCCITTAVDPQDSSMYTKAGVEIKWLPKKGGSTESFFLQTKIATEAELRRDAGKWETVLSNSITKYGKSLVEPEFDLHYIARDGGAAISGTKADVIKYAFVVTLESSKNKELFNDIIRAYPKILTEIEPRVSIPIQV